MSKYANSKIYKIISDQTNKIYIGSTVEKYLSSRLNRHIMNYKRYLDGEYHYVTSYEIIKYGDAKIILLELYPCQCREELLAKEQSYIESLKDNIINRNNAFGKDMEHKREWTKQYIEKNKEVMILKRKKYHEDNKEARNAQRRERYTCGCGAVITIGGRSTHEKTTNHQMLMQIKDNPTVENI